MAGMEWHGQGASIECETPSVSIYIAGSDLSGSLFACG